MQLIHIFASLLALFTLALASDALDATGSGLPYPVAILQYTGTIGGYPVE
jgi:hypothetical protein